MKRSVSKSVFFLLHGDHPTLPHAELCALLETEGFPLKEKNPLPRVLRCRIPLAAAKRVIHRAYMTRLGAEELINVNDDADEIVRAVLDEPAFQELDGPPRLYMYRGQHYEGKESDTLLKDRILTALACRRQDSRNVPVAIEYGAVFSGGRFLLGKLLDAHPQTGLASRSPHTRPFFHPSALMPKLAGCMVNLTRIRENQLLLDPFCGVGSILIEARLLNCEIIGSDLSASMASASRENLGYFGLLEKALVVADARALPFQHIDAIATDPPYGRLSSSRGESSVELVRNFLGNVPDILTRGSFVCMASNIAPERLCLEKRSQPRIVESHRIRVNDSLTRYVTVIRMT